MQENIIKVKLYLDDVRTPKENVWEVVRDYDQFVETVERIGINNIDIMSLDHDLGDSAMDEYYRNVSPNFTLNYDNITEKTGMDCVKWLVEKLLDNSTLKPPTVYVHSANAIGSGNMTGYYNNYLMNCRLEQTCVRVKIPHTVEDF